MREGGEKGRGGREGEERSVSKLNLATNKIHLNNVKKQTQTIKQTENK